jgi:hypothetical protein
MLLQFVIPDVPEDVEIQIARTEFINEKVILRVPDEEFEEFEADDAEEGARPTEGTKDNMPLAAPKAVCCRTLKGKKSRKIKNPDAIAEAPVNPYPHLKGSGWPEMMARSKVAGGKQPTTLPIHDDEHVQAVTIVTNHDDDMYQIYRDDLVSATVNPML